MASNELFSLAEEGLVQQGSIFSELLNIYSNPEIEMVDCQHKLFPVQEWAEEQQEPKNHHKSSGEWVWADDDSFQNHSQNQLDEFKQDALTTDNFELRRVKSLRIEQQDKITMFLKKQSVLSLDKEEIQEQKQEQERRMRSPQKRSTLVNKSQSLSPRKCKSKKIDKFKQFKLIYE